MDHFGLGHDPTAKVAVTIHQQKQFQDKLCVVVEGDKKHLEAIVNSKLLVIVLLEVHLICVSLFR